MYICFEGPDASGKSTQAKLLADSLKESGEDVLLTKEPGSPSDDVCKKIRDLILDEGNEINHRAAFFLFLADRAQHMQQISKVIGRGGYVISDRSSLSTAVYYLAGIKDDSLLNIYKLFPMLSMAQQIKPDIYFLCGASYKWCDNIMNSRKNSDRIEKFGDGFHKRVHNLFTEYEQTYEKYMGRDTIFPDSNFIVPSTDASAIKETHKFIKLKVAEVWQEKQEVILV